MAISALLRFGQRKPARSNAGFTLIEMLIVIGIISILLALIGVVARNARIKARVNSTKGLIKRIEAAMEIYKSDIENGEFPSPVAEERVPDAPLSSVAFLKGTEAMVEWLTDRPPGARFDKRDILEVGGVKYFGDAWGRPILYRKYSRDRMLLWSTGRDGVNDIGTASHERAGDDISTKNVDY